MSNFKHGTNYGYTGRGCRCDACKAARREYDAARRLAAGQPEMNASLKHGTPGTYTNYRCRCAPCTEAWRVSVAAYRIAKAANIRLARQASA